MPCLYRYGIVFNSIISIRPINRGYHCYISVLILVDLRPKKHSPIWDKYEIFL